MTKLLKYHTILADPNHYWENQEVANKLKSEEIKTYEEYQKACKNAGCNCYNEEVFNDFLKNIQF